MRPSRLAAVFPLLLVASVASAGAPPPISDNLQCIKVKDTIAKAQYTADLAPADLDLAESTGCTIKVGAKYLCVDVTKTNVQPPPPGVPANGAEAQKYLCYKTKCPTSPAINATVSDRFGSHPVASKTTGLVCQPATTPQSCTNGLQDSGETGTDCGGACTNDCPDGEGCFTDTDCQSDYCYSGTCLTPTCSDGIWNGSETATDCGGGSCPACADGLLCSLGSDCQSQVCSGTCQAPSCSDAVQNGVETDTDCGGGTCPDCPDGDSCNVNEDCLSGLCYMGSCLM